MSRRSEANEPAKEGYTTVPLRMPCALHTKVKDAKAKTGLAEQDVMRLSLDRGIDILISQLTGRPALPSEDTPQAA